MTNAITRRALLSGTAALGAFALIDKPALANGTLRVGDMNNMLLQAHIEAAGLAKELNYNIEYSKFAAGQPELEALNAGAIDVGETGDVVFMFAYAAQSPVRAIAAGHRGPKNIVALVNKDSRAKSIGDLKGKKIAVARGGAGHIFVLELLERAGLKTEDVELVFLGPAEAKPAFSSGAVDAWAVWPPYSTLAVEEEGARIFADLSDSSGAGTYNYLLATTDAIAKKREQVLDFKNRVFKAKTWALENVDTSAEIAAQYTKLPVELNKKMIVELKPTPVEIDDAIVASLQAAADIFAKHGVIKPLDVSGAFDRSFAA